MLNYPSELAPKRWSEYVGHEREVRRFQGWIGKAPEGVPRAIFVEGTSGVGKTTLVLLLIKTLRCDNRAEDPATKLIEPCGVCHSCQSVDARLADRTFENVHWVQPGGFAEETTQASVKAALLAGARGPGDLNKILFLVFDEWTEIDSRSRQQVLIRSEVETPFKVCHIFITMKPEKLSFSDRVALTARCQTVNLLPFSKEQVAEFLERRLRSKGEYINKDALDLIAEYSEGSARLALSLYSKARSISEEVDLTVAAESIQCATREQRRKLWERIESGTGSLYELKLWVDALLTEVDASKLVKQMQIDLMKYATTKEFEALSLLNGFLLRPVDLGNVVVMLRALGIRGVLVGLQSEEGEQEEDTAGENRACGVYL